MGELVKGKILDVYCGGGGPRWGVGGTWGQLLAAQPREREKKEKEGRSGVTFFVSEGRSTHSPNPSFYFIYLIVYLFIYLGSSSCDVQLTNSPSCAHTF